MMVEERQSPFHLGVPVLALPIFLFTLFRFALTTLDVSSAILSGSR